MNLQEDPPEVDGRTHIRKTAARCWALLLARIFECLPLRCPKCSQPMRIIAFIVDPPVIERILTHVGEPTEPPAVLPARAPHQRRRLRSTNMLERLNKEIKRRTRVATLFPNEQSLLRLVSAILMEVSDEWEAGRIYIRMSNEKLAN